MQLEVSFEDPDTGNIYKEVMEVNLKPNTGAAKKEKSQTVQSEGEVGHLISAQKSQVHFL